MRGGYLGAERKWRLPAQIWCSDGWCFLTSVYWLVSWRWKGEDTSQAACRLMEGEAGAGCGAGRPACLPVPQRGKNLCEWEKEGGRQAHSLFPVSH